MGSKKSNIGTIGTIGIFLGAVGLLLALLHFWAGPFEQEPTIKSVVSDAASSIRQAAQDALDGKASREKAVTITWNTDEMARIAVAILGGVALIFAVLSFVKREPLRVAAGAATLGVSAIAFQFIALYAVAILVLLLIIAVVASN